MIGKAIIPLVDATSEDTAEYRARTTDCKVENAIGCSAVKYRATRLACYVFPAPYYQPNLKSMVARFKEMKKKNLQARGLRCAR